MVKGVTQGEVALLLHLIKQKFKTLSVIQLAEIEARIAHASEEQRLQWADRILEVDSLDDLFNPR